MLYLNGIPKGGTHALMKAVELLGVPMAPGYGLMDRRLYAEAHKGPGGVFIYRHPRDCLVSRVRMEREGVVTQGFLIARMHDLYSEWMGFLPFLSDPEILAVRLEDLRGDGGETIRRIAEHIGKPYLQDAYDNLPGMTYSWNEVPSRWQDHWTPEVDAGWVKERGPEVEKAFGYD